MKFAGRLVTGTMLVLMVTVIVLVWLAEVSLRRDLERDVGDALQREAALIEAALPPNRAEWHDLVRRFAVQSTHRITLVDQNGTVLEDSDVPDTRLGTLESHRTRPEVAAALAGGVGMDIRGSASIGRDMMYVGIRGGPGVVRVAAGLNQVNQIVRQAQRGVILAALIAIVFGSVLAFVAGRAIAGPLTDIVAAAGAIASGQPPRFPHSGIADVDALIRSLREMHAQLNERFEELAREQSEMAAMMDSMAEGVIATDQRGRVVNANAAARRLLGYRPDGVLPDLPHLFRDRTARSVVSEALSGSTVLGRELELDGQVLALTARPLPTSGIILVIHDLTEIRRLEAVRRDFVANVSHELKTPLTSISGYSETLLADLPDQETARRFLQVILANARRMQRLVDSLLDLSRIESGAWQPDLEDVDLEEIVDRVIAEHREKAGAGQISIDRELDSSATGFRADASAIEQILFNLLENAIRHTPPGGRIVCRTRREDGWLDLSVRDSGSGIPREHLPRIFERFYRADSSRSRAEGGTGLGLAIVKHLVEAHNGRVNAESELGKGTSIHCLFPVARTYDTRL